MNDAWDLIRNVAEVVGMVFIPITAWVMFTIIAHGKKIILLEERVSDSLNRRITSLEKKVISMEDKIEAKMDDLEKSVTDCKLAINDKINERFDTLMQKLENSK